MTVYKMIDLVGTSGTSISDAIRGAIERAGATVEDMKWFEVKEIRGAIAENQVAEFQVKVDVAFQVHAAKKHTGTEAQEVPSSRRAGTSATRSAKAQIAAKTGKKGRSDLAKGFERQPSRKR